MLWRDYGVIMNSDQRDEANEFCCLLSSDPKGKLVRKWTQLKAYMAF